MLGLRIVKNTKNLDTGNKVLKPLPFAALLVLENQFIDLAQGKRLFLYQRANILNYVFLPMGNSMINGILYLDFAVENLLALLIDMKQQKVNGLDKLKVL